MDIAQIIINALKQEIAYLNEAGIRLAHRDEEVIKFAICQGLRSTTALAIANGYYKANAQKLMLLQPKERTVDIWAMQKNSKELFVEIHWEWDQKKRSFLENALVPALKDIGKLLDLIKESDSRVMVFVASTELSENEVISSINSMRPLFSDVKELEQDLIRITYSNDIAKLPGGFHPKLGMNLMNTCGYLYSLLKTLSKSTKLEILYDKPPLPYEKTRRYVIISSVF